MGIIKKLLLLCRADPVREVGLASYLKYHIVATAACCSQVVELPGSCFTYTSSMTPSSMVAALHPFMWLQQALAPTLLHSTFSRAQAHKSRSLLPCSLFRNVTTRTHGLSPSSGLVGLCYRSETVGRPQFLQLLHLRDLSLGGRVFCHCRHDLLVEQDFQRNPLSSCCPTWIQQVEQSRGDLLISQCCRTCSDICLNMKSSRHTQHCSLRAWQPLELVH